jgi:hypothetical protein
MVQIPQTYNVDDIAGGTGGLPLIPDGLYKAVIIDSELKATKAGTGQYLALKIVLTEGQYANTEFTERLNIINPNTVAVEIAYKTLANICKALGMAQTPQDSTQIHNKPFLLETKTKKGEPWTDDKGELREGNDSSEIKGYKPIGTPQPVATPAPVAQAAPAPAPTPQAPIANNPFAAA